MNASTNYRLNMQDERDELRKGSLVRATKKLWPLLRQDKAKLFLAFGAAVASSALNLVGPLLTGYAIDQGMRAGNFQVVLGYAAMLIIVYVLAFAATYAQISMIGTVSQRMLWRLRNLVFGKLQRGAATAYVSCDPTIALPILVTALSQTAAKYMKGRKRPTFTFMGKDLTVEVP